MIRNIGRKIPEKIHFHIVRKWAFAGALLTYKIFINGDYAGSLTNGKTLDIEVPRSDFYFIDELSAPAERNAIIRASDMDDSDLVSIEIHRVGGWKTNSDKKFYIYKNGEYVNVLSVDYTHYYHACYDDTIFSGLTEQERLFTRCLEFREAVSDAVDKVLCSEKLFDMLNALKCSGVKQYTKAFDTILEHLFIVITLPLNDEMLNNKGIAAKIEKADHIVRDCEKLDGAKEELHKCLVNCIIEHFAEQEGRIKC